jgi:hypothetical protein
MKRTLSIALLGLLLASPGMAERYFFATIDGLQNVPPHPEVTATGSAELVLNDTETELSYHIVYSGLAGTETGAHIHTAGARDIGPIVHPLPVGTPKDGVWQVTTDDVYLLTHKRLYINIHTTAYEDGEIRGNIMEIPTPVHATTWGAVKALYR